VKRRDKFTNRRLTKIISLIDKTNKWKLMGYERVESWVHPKGTYVILGDACHAMVSGDGLEPA
jgi:salicylate hydroxylase